MIEDLSGSNKTVGLKQTIKAIESGEVNIVYLANDADAKITNKITKLCDECNVKINYIETKKQLGKACGIQVSAAVAAMTYNK